MVEHAGPIKSRENAGAFPHLAEPCVNLKQLLPESSPAAGPSRNGQNPCPVGRRATGGTMPERVPGEKLPLDRPV